MGRFDQPPDDRDRERENEELRERLDPNAREQKEMFVRGRAPDDEAPTFHPLNPDELAQRRLRRGVKPPRPKGDAA